MNNLSKFDQFMTKGSCGFVLLMEKTLIPLAFCIIIILALPFVLVGNLVYMFTDSKEGK